MTADIYLPYQIPYGKPALAPFYALIETLQIDQSIKIPVGTEGSMYWRSVVYRWSKANNPKVIATSADPDFVWITRKQDKLVCEFCSRSETATNPVTCQPDPYAADLYDDNTCYNICLRCYDDRAGDR